MIAIKDFGMPSCCENCDMCLCLDDDYSGLCCLTQTTNMDRTNSRNSDCPLTEIITCKDCKHWIKNRYCYKHTPQVITYESDFCNYGERRE